MKPTFFIIALLCQCMQITVSKRGGSSGGGGSRGGAGGSSVGGSRGTGAGTGTGTGSRNVGASGSRGTFSGGSSSNLGRRGWSPTSSAVAAGLAGVAVGTAVGFGTAAIIHHSYYDSPDTGRRYYYGDSNYRPGSNRIMKCTYKITQNDTNLNNLYVDNTTKVTEIIYECKLDYEECCNGLDCCRKPVVKSERRGLPWWGGLLVAIFFFSCFGCIGCFIYSRIKKSRHSDSHPDAVYVTESYAGDQQNVMYHTPGPTYPQQSSGYPPQSSGYPPQPGFAQNVMYPPSSNVYPPQPSSWTQPSYPAHP